MSDLASKKVILILKPQPQSLLDAEKFLNSRGWKVSSSADIKQALEMLIQIKPQFFLVCLDHPNPQITKIPSLVEQYFSGGLIVSAETANTQILDFIVRAKSEYKVTPPATGPGIERMCFKYNLDIRAKENLLKKQKQEEESGIKKSVLTLDESDLQIFKGSTTVNGIPLQKNEESPELMIKTEGEKSSSETYRFKKKKQSQGSWVPVDVDLIEKGAEDALAKTITPTPSKPDEVIDVVSNLACIVIESSKFSGYLIAAMAKDRKMDEKFIKKIQSNLIRFLKDRGEIIPEGKNLELEVQKVPFEDWALEYAEFLKKSVHEGNEFAMAFFPRQDIKSFINPNPEEQMVSINIKEFKADTPVQFNLYIYLPRNNKYLLYTPSGGILYEDQKERLQKQGVSDLHFKKEDANNVEKYRAENYLNDKINEFEEKGRQDKASSKKKNAA